MVEAAELLKDLGVCGVLRKDSLVRLLCGDELRRREQISF